MWIERKKGDVVTVGGGPMPSELHSPNEILSSRVEIPDHVVYRSFVAETVILNLDTGRYHGVNPSGGFMLELLDKLGSVEAAAEALAREYGLSPEEAADDLRGFCADLEQRGLISRSSAPGD
jgi:hypothetical protein